MNQQRWNDLLVKAISSDTEAEAVSRRTSLLQRTDTVLSESDQETGSCAQAQQEPRWSQVWFEKSQP